ncbi:MAG: hypothetical protein M3R24_19750 [Chloroflexota bacterium]|nr:hypothetical protein [Chloroflexota bacterium]
MQDRSNSTRQRVAVEPAAASSTDLVATASRRTIAVGNAKTIVVQPRIPMPYKAMIWFSFGLNALLLLLLLVGGLYALNLYNRAQAQLRTVQAAMAMNSGAGQRLTQIQQNPSSAMDTARYAVNELMGSIEGLQGAHIRANIPIDQQLPIALEVPVNQQTAVRTTAPVPLVVPARFTLPGGGGQINGSVALSLPVGMELPINLNMTIPISSSVPVKFDVPVDIPMQQTELADDFERLHNLVEPAAELIKAR